MDFRRTVSISERIYKIALLFFAATSYTSWFFGVKLLSFHDYRFGVIAISLMGLVGCIMSLRAILRKDV